MQDVMHNKVFTKVIHPLIGISVSSYWDVVMFVLEDRRGGLGNLEENSCSKVEN